MNISEIRIPETLYWNATLTTLRQNRMNTGQNVVVSTQ